MSNGIGERLRSAYHGLPAFAKKPLKGLYGLVPFPWSDGREFARLHNQFWRSQYWSREQLESLQLQELRRVAVHAKETVPAYRKFFNSIDFDPQDIRQLSDWSQLPITTKADLQDSPADYVSEAIPESEILTHTTSGSTGTPLEIKSVMKTWNAERAMMYRNWRWAGFKSGDRIVTCIGDLSGEILGPSYAPYSRYRNEIEISPDHLDKRTLAYYVDLIREFKPAYFRCYPGVAIVFARFMEDHGIEPPPLKSIWTQSERFTDRDRQYIEGFWGAPINDYYGQQEKAVAAGTCEHGRMHIHSEFCFVELIETDHPPLCKIVTTGFYADAMPLLRYDTKDFTIPLDDPCPCGRELPAIESIVGRVDDWIVRADGSPHIDIESQLKNLGAVRECQMIQESLTYSKILVVPAPNHDYSKKEPFKALMEEDLGPGVTVDIEYVDEIPRTGSGKRRLTISKVANNWVV